MSVLLLEMAEEIIGQKAWSINSDDATKEFQPPNKGPVPYYLRYLPSRELGMLVLEDETGSVLGSWWLTNTWRDLPMDRVRWTKTELKIRARVYGS